jgi:hypothetical protein
VLHHVIDDVDQPKEEDAMQFPVALLAFLLLAFARRTELNGRYPRKSR